MNLLDLRKEKENEKSSAPKKYYSVHTYVTGLRIKYAINNPEI